MLHIKMVCTPLKVLDDCMRMHTHGFSFFSKTDIISKFGSLKENLRRGKVQNNITRVPRSAVH